MTLVRNRITVLSMRELALPSNVKVCDGFSQTITRLVFPYSDKLVQQAERQSPVHLTILSNGEVASAPKSLCLGGVWKRDELQRKSDDELQQISAMHVAEQPTEKHPTREAMIAALVGMERDPNQPERALMTFTVPQTMHLSASAAHLKVMPNANFVWPRDDGTIALVQCWPVRYDDRFTAEFECSTENPDRSVFSVHMANEFKRSMRATFGPAAQSVPLVHARKTSRNPSLVLVGNREALIDFIQSREDVMKALGISETFEDGFNVKAKDDGTPNVGTKSVTFPQQGKSVVYKEDGAATATVKPLSIFNAECRLGPQLTQNAELVRKLSEKSL